MLKRALSFLFLSILLTLPAGAQEAETDLALVLAVDASGSVSPDRWGLQLHGYAEAFRSPEVLRAIQGGVNGNIRVTLVQWASRGEQAQTVEWHTISDAASAGVFAARLSASARVYSGNTSISGGLYYSLGVLLNKSFVALRNVIDVSGDGKNNHGWPPHEARSAVLQYGFTINGLPIIADEVGVAEHYRDEVIGGPGAFLVVAESYAQFAQAIRRKLVLEIASR